MQYTRKKILLGLFTFISFQSLFAQQEGWIVNDMPLTAHWLIQSSEKVDANGRSITTAGYRPEHWYPAEVPNSTLGTLINNGLCKNIFYDRNLRKIPARIFSVPWWYRNTFQIDKIHPGQVYRLRFDGISYRADIWLNGKKIAASDTIEGSFRQFVLDISDDVREGQNILALKITQAGDGELSIGFVDWNPEPADKSMGIWRPVHLLPSGPVSVAHPFVITDVDTATLDHALLTLQVTLQNYSDKSIQGILKAAVGEDISLVKPVKLQAHESKKITLAPAEYHQLSISHPRLWWTHDLGVPHLYDLDLTFEIDHKISDRSHLKFGIRSVSGYMTEEGFRGYSLNGKKILIKGGGWTDPMLLNATPEYEAAGIDYAVHMNLNAIRMEGFWGHDHHIYDLCDEKGILIMAGFSCQWEWKNLLNTSKQDKYSAFNSPEQNGIAADSWHDQILWLRNHPSIFLWLYGSDKRPRPALEKKYLDILKNTDTTRPYVQSAKEWVSALTGPTGMKMRGPYEYVPPNYWYIDTTYGGAFGFNTETGPGPQIPVRESLEKMIPKDSLWPISSSWLYHSARGKFQSLKTYNHAMAERMGKSADLTDYLRKAQYLNYEGMRAMFEAFETNRFEATGIIQWMYNASWPKLWWQLYDYYLMPTGAFYGARIANEPLHISYNYKTRGVVVMNNTAVPAGGLLASIMVYDFEMNKIFQKTIPVNKLVSQETKAIWNLPEDLKVSKTWFLDLRLKNKTGIAVSKNFYVLSTRKDLLDEKGSTWYVTPQSQFGDLKLLQQLPKVQLKTAVTTSEQAGKTRVQVVVKNPASHIAFMVFLDLKKGNTGKSVLPVFWDDNYFTLLPGEERTISVWCHTKDLQGKNAVVDVSGWNVE